VIVRSIRDVRRRTTQRLVLAIHHYSIAVPRLRLLPGQQDGARRRTLFRLATRTAVILTGSRRG
jgi:hypothetical protein